MTEETPEQDDNGIPIIKVEISPNGKYLVTYNKEDRLIVGWNIEDKSEGRLEPNSTARLDYKMNINQICVSDDKKLVCFYIYNNRNYLSK